MGAETLATRGDPLVLQRHQWIYRDQDFEFEFLLLTRWNTDGLLTEAAVHDLADLRTAFERLDDWYIEQLSAIDAARMRATSAYFDAVNDRDLDRAVSTLAPDVVSTTHRAISWGELDRDGVAAGLATITGFDGESCSRTNGSNSAGRPKWLSPPDCSSPIGHGSVMVDRWVTTKRCHPPSGLIALMEHVEPDSPTTPASLPIGGRPSRTLTRWSARP